MSTDSGRPYEPAKTRAAVRRVTAAAIKRRKNTERFPVLTAYDVGGARFVEEAGVDVILVGDSVGNVVLGYDETTPVTMEEMIHHARAVARGSERAHLIVDMPFGSYHVSNEEALRNAIRLVKEASACSVKLEGGSHETEAIRAIASAGIPVVGHIGITPQTAGLGPGYRKRTHRDRLLADAKAVEAAGAFAIVLEMIDQEITAEITRELSIPTIGIGSGPHCDSQVLVFHDVLGMYPASPPFAKRYAEVGKIAVDAFRAYAADIREGKYP